MPPSGQITICRTVTGTSEVSLRTWTTTAATASGVATFYATVDGTASGDALFSGLTNVHATAQTGSVAPLAQVWCSVQSISADLKVIKVACLTGSTVVVGGPSVATCSDGTLVYLSASGM